MHVKSIEYTFLFLYLLFVGMCQVVAAYMMVAALNKKGYNGFTLSVPSLSELQHIYSLAAPVFITMTSKVGYVLVHPFGLAALSHNYPTD